jgi:asparagine synthase (glutamine-hydrolysing)
MCGIAGFLANGQLPLSDRQSLKFREPIEYRGRDGCGEWTDQGKVRLFHSRLSIVDLKDGGQPMNDIDDSLVIVFNGEIYNYLELRAQYEKLGARFRTHSDTEVILEGYKLKGQRVVEDIIGMFAFALWDKKAQELFLARDRLGKKPLYWFDHAGIFYFSSTLSSFGAIPGWTGALSHTALDFYSAVGSFPLGLTAFKQGRSVPPGFVASIRVGAPPKLSRYWMMDFGRKVKVSEGEALREYEEILTDAIRLRLRADVPVALTFSGGVDSGTIAALAAQRLNSPLHCFTVDYHSDAAPSEEAQIAKDTAAYLGLPWKFLHFNYHDELLPALDRVLRVVDQPCNNMVISYSAQLYETIRPHAKVVLSGNGADELFLGYDGNEALRRRDTAAIDLLPRWARGLATCLPTRRVAPHILAAYQCEYVKGQLHEHDNDHAPAELMAALAADIEAAGVTNHADLYTFMALTYYTCDGNFRLPDIAGLNAQVEVRSPFLDHRMVEFAARLPTKFKVGNLFDSSRNKLLPKRCYERHVPQSVAWARKKGMGWNIRYGDSFALDPVFRQKYEEALSRIAEAGLDAERFRNAWARFTQDKREGVTYPAGGGVVMGGFMLGRWLQFHSPGTSSLRSQ